MNKRQVASWEAFDRYNMALLDAMDALVAGRNRLFGVSNTSIRQLLKDTPPETYMVAVMKIRQIVAEGFHQTIRDLDAAEKAAWEEYQS